MAAAPLDPSRPASVVHVAAPMEVGGLERVVQALAVGHGQMGLEVNVVAVVDAGCASHPFLEALRQAHVAVEAIELPARAYRREWNRVRQICIDLKPDIVHTHGYRCDLVDGAAARRMGIATVTTVHGFTGGGWKNRLYERLQLLSFRRFQAVVAVSRAVASRLRAAGVREPRLHVVPNAWSGSTAILDRAAARRELGVPAHGFRVGWVGRLSQEKGADVLVDAMSHIADRSLAASFIGTGPERAELARRAAARGLQERMTWHGMVPDAGRLVRAFDVFVLSSRTEGTPITLFEAMAGNVPVVATAVGGVPDVVTEAEAVLVAPDDPAALATGIESVLRDVEETRARMQAASRRLAEQFAPEPWLRQYERIYQDLRRI